MTISKESWHHRIYARSEHAGETLGSVAYTGVVFCGLMLSAFGLLFAVLGTLFLAQAIVFMTGMAATETTGSSSMFAVIGTVILGIGLRIAHKNTGILDRPLTWMKQRLSSEAITITD